MLHLTNQCHVRAANGPAATVVVYVPAGGAASPVTCRLADDPHHVTAARKAGVPYTTLCSMLKKLDLT